jgi:hypothetical protein
VRIPPEMRYGVKRFIRTGGSEPGPTRTQGNPR